MPLAGSFHRWLVAPGPNGAPTLELPNVANLPIALYHRMKVVQVLAIRLTKPGEHPSAHRRPKLLDLPGANLTPPAPTTAPATA